MRKSFPLISNKHRVWPSFIKGETYYPLYVTFAQLLALVLVDSHQGLLARKQDPAEEAVPFVACSTGVFWAGEIGACYVHILVSATFDFMTDEDWRG